MDTTTPAYIHMLRGAEYALSSALGTEDTHFESAFYRTAFVKRSRFAVRAIWAARPLIPYALMPVNNEPDTPLIWLNRDYKPLGVSSNSWVDYAMYTSHHVNQDDPRIATIRRECADKTGSPHRRLYHFLYSDITTPRTAGMAARLLKLVRSVRGIEQ